MAEDKDIIRAKIPVGPEPPTPQPEKEYVTLVKVGDITLQEYLPTKKLVLVVSTKVEGKDVLMMVPALECLRLLEKHKDIILGKTQSTSYVA